MPTLPQDQEEMVVQLVRDFGDTLPGVRSILESVERYRQCFRDDHCAIPLTNGGETLVDLEDFWILSGYKFCRSCKYAATTAFIGKRHKYAHQLIMCPPDGYVVDHINRNGLDNRRANLRVVSKGKNNINRTPGPSRYGFVGVRKATHSIKRPYFSEIQMNGKRQTSEFFPTPEEAARAYDEMARELHGEFAVLNFPDE